MRAKGGLSITYHTTHKVWGGMIQRCRNPNNDAYRYYGARGIAVCERWRTFALFLEDMGPRPDGLTIERKDNDKGYEPGNCRWAPPEEQHLNQRYTSANRAKTHCQNGHPLSGDNLRVNNMGRRICRTCKSAWRAVYERKRRATKNGAVRAQAYDAIRAEKDS